ncbi:MAG: glycoside hydrolase, partial [Planctomycetota bacterium]
MPLRATFCNARCVKRLRGLTAAWVLCAFAATAAGEPGASSEPAAAPARLTLELRPDETHQTIDGFGASGGWCGSAVGAWPEAARHRVLELLFDHERGAALSIYRYDIGAGGGQEQQDDWRRVPCVEVAPGEYDLTRDPGVRLAREAVAAGADRLVAFANSPPGRLTRNGMTRVRRGEKESNLPPENYAAYATYLCDIVTLLREAGLPVAAVSPINEPQWAWDSSRGEGLHLSPDQAVAFLEAYARQHNRRLPEVGIEAFESGSWPATRRYLKRVLASPLLVESIDSLAVHSYWSTNRDRRRFAGWWRGRKIDLPKRLPIRMTEFCQMRRGREPGMDSACQVAETIIADLTINDVISWSWWLAVSNMDYRDGLIQSSGDGSWIEPNKRLWSLAHFARFMPKGSVRIGARCMPKQGGSDTGSGDNVGNPGGEPLPVMA